MAVPTSITDLSTTAASNSPAGSDSIGTSLDDYLRAISAIIKESGATLYTAGGTVDALTFATTPTFSAYASGQRFFVKAAGANTGAATLNINGLGAKNIYKNGATALSAGDIPAANAHFLVEYDGTQFQLLNPAIGAAGTFTPVLSFGAGTTGITYSIQSGSYTRIGDRVEWSCYIFLTSKGSSTGAAAVAGLPFSSANSDNAYASVSPRATGVTYGGMIMAIHTKNTATVSFEQLSEAGSNTSMTDANFANTSSLILSGSYRV